MTKRVQDLPKLTIRCSEAEKARLLALAQLTGRPVYRLLLEAADDRFRRLTPEMRRKVETLAALRGSEPGS